MASEPRRKGAMALGLAALLFVTGVASGVAVDRWLVRGSSEQNQRRWWERRRPEALAQRYREELGLDQTQAGAVEQVLRRTWAATRKTFAPVEPEVDAIRRRGDDEIRALLRPEQRKRFEEMVAEQERRRDAMRKGLEAPGRQ
ncbi:MAG TPA: hypothetical protein VK698_19495 [Kofleriaceae bacterium]|nr:hypothetical protein [Kofleriaceae bacterium]